MRSVVAQADEYCYRLAADVPRLDSVNPTGSLFIDYDPHSRTGPLGPGVTTLDKALGKHPDEPITIYRGHNGEQKEIVPGDFVAAGPMGYEIAKSYAAWKDNLQEGQSPADLGGRYKSVPQVLTRTVGHGDVAADPGDPEGGEYIYRPRTAATPTASRWYIQAAHDGVFWHGSPSGELVGSPYGVHVGTYEAAREALEARIGRRADGKPWDGTQEYGKTLLDRNQYHHRFDPETRQFTHEVEERDPELPSGRASYSDGTPVAMDARPDVFPVRITGPMSNTPETPHPDWKANGYMRAQTTRGTAKRGYYYTNEGEGVTHDPLTGNVKYSISAVVPNGGTHLERLSRDQHPFPPFDMPKYNSGYNAGF